VRKSRLIIEAAKSNSDLFSALGRHLLASLAPGDSVVCLVCPLEVATRDEQLLVDALRSEAVSLTQLGLSATQERMLET
jgi:hypothetical protein